MKKLLTLLLGGSLILSLSACSLFAPEEEESNQPRAEVSEVNPQEVIDEMQTKMQDVQVMSYDFSITANIDAGQEGSGQAVFALNGYNDNTDSSNPEGELDMTGNFELTDGEMEVSGSADVSFIYQDQMAYFVLNALDLEGEDMEMMVAMVEDYIGVWYEMPFAMSNSQFDPAMLSEAFAEGFQEGLTEDADLTEEQKEEIETLVNETDWYTIENNQGTTDHNGTEVYAFDVILDNDALYDFMVELSTIMEENMSETELEDLRAALDAFTLEGTMYIGVDDKYLYLFDGNMTLEADEETYGEEMTVEMTMEIEMSDFGQTKDIEVPEETEVFDPTSLFMGGGTYPGTMEYDDTDWEDWESEDWEDIDLDELEAEMEMEMDAETEVETETTM